MAALPRDDPQRDEVFVMGDINSSLIKTARGRTILLQHDVSTPRPYSQINHVQGTRGAFRGYPDRLALVSVKAGEEWIERSEEHTSELQSLMRISYAVFCLNKKKAHT